MDYSDVGIINFHIDYILELFYVLCVCVLSFLSTLCEFNVCMVPCLTFDPEMKHMQRDAGERFLYTRVRPINKRSTVENRI